MFAQDKNVEIQSHKINFLFEGKKYTAFDGDTVSSALIRNGIKNFREDKSKNFRGAYCNMGICNECIVEINGNQSVKACTKKIFNDDQIFRQKYNADLPLLKKDIQLEKTIINYDILIIGAGPGGIGSSLGLKSSNKKIALIDEKESIGGQYYKKLSKIFTIKSYRKLEGQIKEGIRFEEKISNSNIELFLGYKIWGVYKNEKSTYEICCSKDNLDLRITCKQIIVATGSYEKPFFF